MLKKEQLYIKLPRLRQLAQCPPIAAHRLNKKFLAIDVKKFRDKKFIEKNTRKAAPAGEIHLEN